jgi:hypothetical protein
MNHQSLTLRGNADISNGSGGKRAFVRHLGEMVLAMLVVMVVLGGLAELGFAGSGGSLSDQPGGVQVVLMAFTMTLPMVIWMSHRGHSRARNAEMAASMIVPSLLAAALAWAAVLEPEAALGVQHTLMIPAMLGVMLWRDEHYSQPHSWVSPRRK